VENDEIQVRKKELQSDGARPLFTCSKRIVEYDRCR
jgi:hypothetical protein